MYKTLFCLSAAALFVTGGASAEETQDQVVEQAVASCSCGKSHKPKEGSEGDKGNKNVAQMEENIPAGETLSCGKCK